MHIDEDLPEILMCRFPYPSWINDPLLTALQGFVSIIFMLSFVYSCINTVKVITTEKEKQLKVLNIFRILYIFIKHYLLLGSYENNGSL